MDYDKRIKDLQAQSEKAEQMILNVLMAAPAVMAILYTAIEKFYI